ncbi:SAM-dependent methyltransferase [Rhodovulum sp. BSW8]|uniref:class I SAM-dependent methyltransferase n=1 Tax=Rhodovulum sp. BSW8 TaxID=2259645 RepID=UPI000DE56917|nr:methyltransferase domain-containing protein [Rhodovulum sp. BSW8]RBO51360.1 SAM-dependent methyltransferase [Rhodovulum sp. BSW8]
MDTLTLDPEDVTATLKTVLHVGCGMADPAKLPTDAFPTDGWRELRLDIDPSVMPDIVASITDMRVLAEGSVDAVWSSHNLEHLRAHEVPLALSEFCRVLRPGGFALMTMPDLQRVAMLVAQGLLEEPAYISAAGPISPIDILYGYRPSIQGGNDFMAHRTGFTIGSLSAHMTRAGFVDVQVESDGRFALWARGVRPA